MAVGSPVRVVELTLRELVRGVEAAVPRAVAGLVFAAITYVAIEFVLAVLRVVLERVYEERQALVVRLLVTVAGLFLWFGAALGFLKVSAWGGSPPASAQRPGSSRWASPTPSRR